MCDPVRTECPGYPALAELLDHDAAKVRLVLRVFHSSASDDLRQMELAAGAGYWPWVKRLAHRVASGCRHIGEEAVADTFVTLEHTSCTAAPGHLLVRRFERARRALIAALERAAACIDADMAKPEATQ